jgi:DNA-binding beta-propeller fold protein YncE
MNRREFLKLSGQGVVALGLLKGGCIRPGPGNGGGPGGLAVFYGVGTDYLDFDGEGHTYRLLKHEHAVQRLAADGSVVWDVGGLGSGDGELNFPAALVVDGDGQVYVLDVGNSRVKVFDRDGNYLRQIGGRVEGSDDDPSYLDFPRDMALDGEGRLYVCDSRDHHIHVFGRDGNPLGEIGEFGTEDDDLNYPKALAIDPQGNLHVIDSGNTRIQVYDASGNHLRSYGSFGTEDGELQSPRAIAIDGAGNAYVADGAGWHIDVFGPDGTPRETLAPAFDDGRPAVPLHLSWAPGNELYVTGVPGMV